MDSQKISKFVLSKRFRNSPEIAFSVSKTSKKMKFLLPNNYAAKEN